MSGTSPKKTEVVIVGGGLSGLHTAWRLQQRGIAFTLCEARERLGGRVLSPWWSGSATADASAFDLGPAWFWPHQPRMRALIKELSLEAAVFEQWSKGLELVENAQRHRHQGRFGVSMAGSLRLDGGLATLSNALAATLGKSQVWLNAPVERMELQDNGVLVTTVQDSLPVSIECDSVVLALPPRVAAATLRFEPRLSERRQKQLEATPTWMAGHCKLVAIYSEPFWRSEGLSGDAFSQVGPLQELHDASPRSEAVGALFGFVGLPPGDRSPQETLREAAVGQLERLFGPAAARPLHIIISDWSQETFTATRADQHLRPEHSHNEFREPVELAWSHRLIWSGSETASPGERNHGYLEGALEASERTIAALLP